MATTPPFMPGQIPGIGSGGGVPGIPPAPQGGSPAPQTGDPNEKAKQILATLLQAAGRKQMANTAVPGAMSPVDNSQSYRQIGMNTANPAGWSTARGLGAITTAIKNGVSLQKNQQLLKAEGDWTYLQSALNELYTAQQSGDPAAIKAAQAKVDVTMGDPKKLKNMAKALNQDWLNPEKTTAYGEALKKVTAKQQQEDATNKKKQGAAQNLKQMFQHLIQKAQGGPKPQLSDEQRTAMGREIQEKAPTTQGVTDPKAAAEIMRAEAELIRAQKSSPEKYEFKTQKQADGSEIIVALDKTDPTKPAIEVKSHMGENVKPGGRKFVDDGKLEVVSGVPTGRVKREGNWIAPGQAGYTKQDEEAVKLGLNAQGFSDKQKEKLAAIRGESYARGRALYSFKDVTDTKTGEVREVSAMDMAREPGRYTGASEQEKVSARDAVHESLTTNFKALEKSLDKLPNGLDAETQATLKLAMHSNDPGLFETLIVNKIKQGAPDEVLQYLTNMKAMQEDVMVLRSVGGMGTGSDTMRNAMVALIPGPGTSSVKEAKMQIGAAKRTTEALFSRRPQSKLPDNTGTVTFKEGKTTYQIPADQVKEFMKDKPKAQRVQVQ